MALRGEINQVVTVIISDLYSGVLSRLHCTEGASGKSCKFHWGQQKQDRDADAWQLGFVRQDGKVDILGERISEICIEGAPWVWLNTDPSMHNVKLQKAMQIQIAMELWAEQFPGLIDGKVAFEFSWAIIGGTSLKRTALRRNTTRGMPESWNLKVPRVQRLGPPSQTLKMGLKRLIWYTRSPIPWQNKLVSFSGEKIRAI